MQIEKTECIKSITYDIDDEIVHFFLSTIENEVSTIQCYAVGGPVFIPPDSTPSDSRSVKSVIIEELDGVIDFSDFVFPETIDPSTFETVDKKRKITPKVFNAIRQIVIESGWIRFAFYQLIGYIDGNQVRWKLKYYAE